MLPSKATHSRVRLEVEAVPVILQRITSSSRRMEIRDVRTQTIDLVPLPGKDQYLTVFFKCTSIYPGVR
jgi:hypothetical protein